MSVCKHATDGRTVACLYLYTVMMTNKPETYFKTVHRPKDNYLNHASCFIPTRAYRNKRLLHVLSVCGLRPSDIINCLISPYKGKGKVVPVLN
jgi:hypothetical protein